MLDWYGPIAFFITFFGIIGLIFVYLHWKVYHQGKKKKKKD